MSGSGHCACGAISYTASSELRPVINCHCERCRRVTGHFMAATAAPIEAITLTDDEHRLTWWEPAPGVFYGFCASCGSTLFWRADAYPAEWSIAAGTLDVPTGLSTQSAWWVAHASDYHRLDPSLRWFPEEPGPGMEQPVG